jgi:phenylacetate-CoA ligase
LYFEIIDPQTGDNVPDGEYGELVITTLRKEGAPLIRYRTRDITRLLPGKCACGLNYPRHDIIMGRTDDMIKIKGVNIYPGQIEDVLKKVDGASSEYQIQLDRTGSKDSMILSVEIEETHNQTEVEEHIKHYFKTKIGILIHVQGKRIGELPRSEKKTKRVIDNRYE